MNNSEELLKMDKTQLIELIDNLQDKINKLTALNNALTAKVPFTPNNWDFVMGNMPPEKIIVRELTDIKEFLQDKINTLTSILQYLCLKNYQEEEKKK